MRKCHKVPDRRLCSWCSAHPNQAGDVTTRQGRVIFGRPRKPCSRGHNKENEIEEFSYLLNIEHLGRISVVLV